MDKLKLLTQNLTEVQKQIEDFELHLKEKDSLDAVKLLGDYNEKVFVPFNNLLIELGMNEEKEDNHVSAEEGIE